MRRATAALGVTALMWAGMSLVVPQVASAATATSCTDDLAAGTYGKVIVPEGAVCLSDGPVTIRGGLWISPGATFQLGSDENPVDTGTISGGVHATNAKGVQIHHVTINGGLDIHGGDGPFGPPFDVTWNAIEDNVIHGGATIDGYNGFWMGFLGNDVRGDVNLTNNVLTEDDANEYVSNTVHGNLNCSGDSPAPQVGDSEGGPNQVTGQKTGQCSAL